MAKADRINQLYSILKNARHPVSKKALQEQMECGEKTVRRYIEELRDTNNLQIDYIRDQNGYVLVNDREQGIEVPGYVFNSRETHALLLIDRLVANLESGLLSDDLKPLREHMAKIRQKLNGSSDRKGNDTEFKDNSVDRIRIITIGKRMGDSKYLMAATSAVLKRQKLEISYSARSNILDEETVRVLSPQRLTHYRDNWFLDAWCHHRNALRTFSLDRINSLKISTGSPKNLSNKQLDAHYAKTFGIFGGDINGTAVLKFNAHRANWVAEEQWHPDQKGNWLDDGSYQLEIPYGSDFELVGDILKYGADVEVIKPPELRLKIKQEIEKSLRSYG